jgi:hypothetical protein
MRKAHYIYRPATREYLQYFDIESKYGPHFVWSGFSKAYPFESPRKAREIAETITKADRIRTQIITFSEAGRRTIDWRESDAEAI